MIEHPDQLAAYKYSAQSIASGDKCVPALKAPFLVPIYQRLYTWEAKHVECLLTDAWEAWGRKPEMEYFIGAVVVCPDEDGHLELIDGQQRMTTLWLIASVLHSVVKTPWWEFMAVDGKPRLDFTGRIPDKQSMVNFIEKCGCASATDKTYCNGWLKNKAMIVARDEIIRFIEKKFGIDVRGRGGHEVDKLELEKFSSYLWSKATFVITRLHEKIDRNRFFDSMNSRGVQLEKHEILKARLLNRLPDDERRIYAKAWSLCADIDGYLKLDVNNKFDFGLTETNNYGQLFLEMFESCPQVDGEPITLDDIISRDKGINKEKKGEELDRLFKYKSVVSFPTFLLHVLNLFLRCEEGTEATEISLDHSKLIETFEKQFFGVSKGEDKQRCKSFIHCLLRCRLLMDNFIIKGQVDDKNNAPVLWDIVSWSGGNNKSRTKRTGQAWRSIIMLQSMMYFSQDLTRVPWLSKILIDLYALKTDSRDGFKVLEDLEVHDADYASQVLNGKTLQVSLCGGGDDGSYLKAFGFGTATPHYWFYKLDYLLWKMWFNSGENRLRPEILKSASADFRMRHVTSIEHVSPQSKNNGHISDQNLDRFGNLALLSVGENSSYSDKDPVEKKGAFEASLKRGLIQSLKLAHLFSIDNDWNDNSLEIHEKEMLKVLEDDLRAKGLSASAAIDS